MEEQGGFIRSIFLQWGFSDPYCVGQGAFGRVYRVKQVGSGQIMACKVSSHGQMLCREGELLRKIRHPLFPQFYDMRESGGFVFLFMEYVYGTDLEVLLRKRKWFSQKQAIHIGVQIAQGLLYLHEQDPPVFFLDLKPGNIRIRENGSAALLDLGSAGTREELANVITGTPEFAAPEQMNGSGSVGSHSDVYGLARVMYRIHSGYFGRVEDLLMESLNRKIGVRIPDMRCFLNRLLPYDEISDRKLSLLWKSRFGRQTYAERYLFVKNIIKFPN